MAITVGSLFSGAGMLDMGLAMFADIDVRFFCEFDKDASKVLAHHHPDIPNLGDITKVDWSQIEPVEMLLGGFPCQDISSAGKRKGIIDGERSALWFEYAKAIREIRPTWVLIENVRALVTRGLDIVLGTLADAGYDCRWLTLRASETGVPHRRDRCFILAKRQDASDPKGFSYSDEQNGGYPFRFPVRTEPRAGYRVDSGNPATRTELSGRGSCVVATSSDSPHDRFARRRGTRPGREGSQDNRERPSAHPQSNQRRLLDGNDVRIGGREERLGENAGDGCPSHPQGPPTDAFSEHSERRGEPGDVDGEGRAVEGEARQREWSGNASCDSGATSADPDRRGCILDSECYGGTDEPRLEASLRDDPDGCSEDAGGAGPQSGAVGVEAASDSDCTGREGRRGSDEGPGEQPPAEGDLQPRVAWGKYEPAIRRWENLFRPVPHPHDDRGRLNPVFVSWMMGLPEGWVTDIVPKRTAQLKILGNGVVPPQACLAMRLLTDDSLWQLPEVQAEAA